MDDDLLPSSDCLSHLVKFDNNGITQPMRFNLDGSCAEISPVKYDLSDPFIINPKDQQFKTYTKSSLFMTQLKLMVFLLKVR